MLLGDGRGAEIGMSVQLCGPELVAEVATSSDGQDITRLQGRSWSSSKLWRTIDNCESIKINNHCIDIACHLEYTNAPQGVHPAVASWTAKSCIRAL